jgi:PTS system mannose-specific IIA component
MIGIVLVTHGRLAVELRAAMEHVVGEQRNVATMCIGADDDIDRCREEIQARIVDVDQGDGVVLLTDMFGGTPSNLAISMMDREGVEVIGGVNLPMLVKLAKVRSLQTLAECVDCAELAGRKYICAASHAPGHGPTALAEQCRKKLAPPEAGPLRKAQA